MNYIAIAGYSVLALFLVYRQFSAGPVSGRNLVMIPALIGFGTVQTLGHSLAGISPVGLGLLALNALIGVGFGVWRGQTFAIWSEAGVAMRRGTWMTLWNWLAMIAARLPLAAVAVLAGVPRSATLTDLMVSLFLTFAAQNLVIWMRSQDAAAPHPAAVPGVR